MTPLQADSLAARFSLAKQRWRLARALRAGLPGEQASLAELDHLVQLQLAPWAPAALCRGPAQQRQLQALNAQSISSFVLSIRGRQVAVWDKPAVARPAAAADDWEPSRLGYRHRALLYQDFLRAAVASARPRLDLELDLVLDVADLVERSDLHQGLPTLCFQKPQGTDLVLLPDVDFFHSRWYAGPVDPLAYDDKSISAVFVGSSTGAALTLDDVLRDATPRLRAARYFHGHPQVVFRIAQAAQCVDAAAREALLAKPYFSAYVSWEQQLAHRFILSMDGNGAACSRLVKGLLSQSVLVKFRSPHQLYYFPAMVAGRDHLEVDDEAAVERLLQQELARPGLYRGVAEAGQRFARRYLSAASVLRYTQRLLQACARLQGG